MMDGPKAASNAAAEDADGEDCVEGSLSSSSSSDLAPRMQAQFNNLSSVLAETNENLLSFEFMLQQYKQQARIRPISKAGRAGGGGGEGAPSGDGKGGEGRDDPALSETQVEMNDKLERLLSELSEAVGKVASLKDHVQTPSEAAQRDEESALRKELARTREALTESEARVQDLERQKEVLEQDRQSKAGHCEQLAESAHRARSELKEERERRQRLDEKLEKEQRAARKVGEDITRYVEQMRGLEEEVAMLRRERKVRGGTGRTQKAVVDMQGDTLVATIEEPEEEEEVVVLRSKLEEERSRVRELQSRVARYEEQEGENERQLAELKSGLVAVQKELEEKCHMLPPITAGDLALESASSLRDKEKIRQMESDQRRAEEALEAKQQELDNLRLKSKVLVQQYRRKKSQLSEQSGRMSSARARLGDIMAGCAVSERNYCTILCHLGSQVEVSVRLLAAYLGVELAHREPVRMSGRPLGEWFADVQAMSSWLQGQLVAFGKRVWTEKESIDLTRQVLAAPRVPAGRMEDGVDWDDDEERELKRAGNNRSVREAIKSQEKISIERRSTLEALTETLTKSTK